MRVTAESHLCFEATPHLGVKITRALSDSCVMETWNLAVAHLLSPRLVGGAHGAEFGDALHTSDLTDCIKQVLIDCLQAGCTCATILLSLCVTCYTTLYRETPSLGD